MTTTRYLIDEEKYIITNIEKKDSITTLSVQGREDCSTCNMCHKQTKKRQDLLKREQSKSIVHYIEPITQHKVMLQLTKKYFRCTACHSSFMETFDLLAENGKHTKIFESQVHALLAHKKVKEISKLLQVSQWKIYKIISSINLETVQITGEKIIQSLQDIVLHTHSYINKENRYYYIITDEVSNLTLAVIESPNKELLNQWYQELDRETKGKIKGISISMHPHIQSNWKNISIIISKEIPDETRAAYSRDFIQNYS